MGTVWVNGTAHELGAGTGRLLSFLRSGLGLTGTKPGCGEGQCGACTVLVDERPVLACQVGLEEVVGHSVTTIEGLAPSGQLHPIQQALIEEAASQCGYCTPAMALRAAALLTENPRPTDDEIAGAMEPNLCRCGCYLRIAKAVHRAGALIAAGERVVAPPALEQPALARPKRPWDLCRPEERDYFSVLGPGLVTIWPPPAAAPGMWRAGGGAWLHVAPSGQVTAFSGKVDVGQDNATAFRLLVAEELAAAFEDVHVVQGDTDLCPFDIGTFGSRSMPDAGEALRRAAAGAREVLVDLAAAKWTVAPGRLLPSEGVVRDHTGGFLRYGDLVAGLSRMEVLDHEPELREGTALHLVGHLGYSPERVDVVTGRRRYGSDLELAGMLDGAVLRPPVRGAVLRAADLDLAARAGVITVRDGEFLGIVAPSPSEARGAIAAVVADWELPADGPRDVPAYLRSHPAASSGWERAVDERNGDVEEALCDAASCLEATYTTAFIAHVPLETRAALAEWDAGRLTLWAGTQVPFGVRAELADALGVDEADVRVIVPPTGGGFGGKHAGEVALEAARLARAVDRPVKVHWSRDEEFQFGYLRPMAVIDVRAGLDHDGGIAAWDFLDINAGAAGLSAPYRTGAHRLRFQPATSPLAQGSYRALAANANNFARESFVDELAAVHGVDPLAFRLANLDDYRIAEVLGAAADRFGWPSAPVTVDGVSAGQGLALGFEKGGRVATCAEVGVAPDGDVRVRRLVVAYECGRVVNPDTVVNQIEGAVVMALGGALFEEVAPTPLALADLSLSGYRVPRFSDIPEIDVVLLDRPDQPSAGAGETPMIAVAPAIANAVANAAGRRIRSLPILPGASTPASEEVLAHEG